MDAIRTETASAVFSRDDDFPVATTAPPSVYEPLNVHLKEMRLLQIDHEATQASGTIKCSLSKVSLLDGVTPTYAAISWCWGDPTKCSEITINGTLVGIPANAEKALRSVCSGPRTYSIWLDAVCINQDDTVERGEQAFLMKDVYSQADSVLVWLGEDEHGKSQSAIDSIWALIAQCERSVKNRTELAKLIFKSGDTIGAPSYSRLPLPEDCDWDALESFYSADWFQRLWVVQEVALAKQALCICGDRLIPWRAVGLAACWMVHRQYWRKEYCGHGVAGVYNAFRIMACDYFQLYSHKLWSLLELGRSFNTSDPRDKVFGLLGLHSQKRNVRKDGAGFPDYSLSTLAVYRAATRAAIMESRGLSILEGVDKRLRSIDGEADREHFPSWVPHLDWAYDELKGSRPSVYQVSARNADNSVPMVLDEAQTDNNVLSLHGIEVGEVVLSLHGMRRTSASKLHESSAQILCGLWVAARHTLSARADAETAQKFAVTMISGANVISNDYQTDEQLLSSSKAFRLQHVLRWQEGADERELVTDAFVSHDDSRLYLHTAAVNGMNRKSFITGNGLMGLGPLSMADGDRVCVLFGGKVPFILRPHGETWKLLGGAYVHDLMEVSKRSLHLLGSMPMLTSM